MPQLPEIHHVTRNAAALAQDIVKIDQTAKMWNTVTKKIVFQFHFLRSTGSKSIIFSTLINKSYILNFPAVRRHGFFPTIQA